MLVSAGCDAGVHTGGHLLQTHTNRIHSTEQWEEMVEAQAGIGRLTALGGGGRGERGRGPSFFSG